MPTLEQVEKWFSIGNSAVVMIGLPLALIQYWYSRKKEHEDRKKDRDLREMQTYQGINNRYWDFQQLCMDHPELDVFDWPDGLTNVKDATAKRELIAFNMLLSLFERVFLLYLPLEEDFRKRQWNGWDEIIKLYCERTNFQEAWQKLGFQWDEKFLEYINRKLPENRRTQLPQTSSGYTPR